MVTNPSEFLNKAIGTNVVIKLKTGTAYRGILVCIDANMNTVLEQSEEVVDGRVAKRFGDTYIRGSNIYYIGSPEGLM